MAVPFGRIQSVSYFPNVRRLRGHLAGICLNLLPASTRVVLVAPSRYALANGLIPVAATLAAGPTLAYGSIRRAVAFSAGHPLGESLAQEAEYMALTGGSQDHAAAVSAFLAKEQPTFTGR